MLGADSICIFLSRLHPTPHFLCCLIFIVVYVDSLSDRLFYGRISEVIRAILYSLFSLRLRYTSGIPKICPSLLCRNHLTFRAVHERVQYLKGSRHEV